MVEEEARRKGEGDFALGRGKNKQQRDRTFKTNLNKGRGVQKGMKVASGQSRVGVVRHKRQGIGVRRLKDQ